MQHLTLGYLTLNTGPAETVTAAAEAGFRSVGIRITGRRISDPYTEVVGNPAMIGEIRSRLADGGLRLSNVTAYHIFPDLTLDRMKRVIDTTAELGASILLAHTYVPIDDWLIDLFSSYCRHAAGVGIRIACETMKYSEARTLEDGIEWLDRAAQPNAGFVFDPLHVIRSGGTPEALAGVDRDRIVFAQICDAKRGRFGDREPTRDELLVEARTGRLPPGEGDLPLYAYLDALPADVELEYEVPLAGRDDLDAGAKAKLAARQMHEYLAQYNASRGRPDPWPSA